MKLHLSEITNDVDGRGYLGTGNHTVTTIRFYDLDDVKMEGFNHQNAIQGLDIIEERRTQGPTPVFSVDFRPAFGMMTTFTCLRIGLVDANPCTEDVFPNG